MRAEIRWRLWLRKTAILMGDSNRRAGRVHGYGVRLKRYSVALRLYSRLNV